MNNISFLQKGYLLLAALAPIVSHAQSSSTDSLLNRTVVVEQEYNPEIMDATKINSLPQVKEPSVPKQRIAYSLQSHPVSSFQTYQPLESLPIQNKKQKQQRGYIRFGYGNRGNIDGKAGYLFRLSDYDELRILGSFRGMKGKITDPQMGKYNRHDYRTHAHINYRHRFAKTEMEFAGQWKLHNLGLHPLSVLSHQRFSNGGVHWLLKSADETLPVLFVVETNWDIHKRIHNLSGFQNKEIQATEHQVYTHATASGIINEQQRISLQLKMHNFLYTNKFFTDYTSLQLNPFYELANDRWQLRIGAHADISLGFGKNIRLAPDMHAYFSFAESYQIYVKAEGGQILNSFDRLGTFCPYATLTKGNQLENTYEQINTSIGFKASPCTGLHLHLHGGYQNLKNELYQQTTSKGNIELRQTNGNNLYAGLKLQYEYKDFFVLKGEGIYRHWDITDEALLFKPTVELNASLDIRPIRPLYLRMAYHYRKPQSEKDQQATVHNLKAGADYTFGKNLSVYISFDNLLNKTYCYYWDYPEQGFTLLGGLSFKF